MESGTDNGNGSTEGDPGVLGKLPRTRPAVRTEARERGVAKRRGSGVKDDERRTEGRTPAEGAGGAARSKDERLAKGGPGGRSRAGAKPGEAARKVAGGSEGASTQEELERLARAGASAAAGLATIGLEGVRRILGR